MASNDNKIILFIALTESETRSPVRLDNGWKNRHPTKNVEPLLVACFNNMEALVCLIELKQATLKPHAVYYDNMSL